ncbi:SpoIIE family protein phosphatase [Streptomyces sp. So13.3]|uniref:SpoIIE family protein phosphatase n=1 Tax=Streptomyces TaxID=1883 RepID=UPI00110711C9|nr:MULTISPECIES: SpoIIE family protein phosphatase [Streptomyces]QNA77590.1 SpoIIE family protein phosphatase [Streptomyces sp. So13.3]
MFSAIGLTRADTGLLRMRRAGVCSGWQWHRLARTYRVQLLGLRPGDRLVMLTDGMLERNATTADLSDPVIRTRELRPREAARALIGAIVDAGDGRMEDDATVRCLDWHGLHHFQSDAATGADLTDASRPELMLAQARKEPSWRPARCPAHRPARGRRSGRPPTSL